jgi:hypothetical protein
MEEWITPEQAQAACDAGQAPRGLRVAGNLAFWSSSNLTHLPDDLQVDRLTLSSVGDLRALPRGLQCDELIITDSGLTWLPDDLQVRTRLSLTRCPYIRTLPHGMSTRHVELRACDGIKYLPADMKATQILAIERCAQLETLPVRLRLQRLAVTECERLRSIPADMQVTKSLTVRGCVNLEFVPPLTVETLDLSGSTSLRELPEGLRVRNLTVANCTGLVDWPVGGITGLRRLDMGGCVQLSALPPDMRQYDALDLRDCVSLRSIPERLRVTDWLDVGGLPWRALPLSSRGFRLRWRGVAISGRALYHPETLTAAEVLDESNAELRRVMLERMDFARFVREARAIVRSEDVDPGGPRQLLEVSLSGDEPLVCLAVSDPSTGRQYVIRVPPWMRTCHQAAAWIAGFNDPDEYQPVHET